MGLLSGAVATQIHASSRVGPGQFLAHRLARPGTAQVILLPPAQGLVRHAPRYRHTPEGGVDHARAIFAAPSTVVELLPDLGEDQVQVLVAHAARYENLYTWNAETLSKRQALMKYRGWSLTGFGRETGDELWSVPLPSEPLYNGIAVASGGTVIVTLRDGTLLAVAN